MDNDLNQVDKSFALYFQERVSHWNTIALQTEKYKGWGNYYHRRLADIYKFLIVPGQRVLEIGCGTGDLLAAVKPAYGVGVDFSFKMLMMAKTHHPELHFIQSDAHKLNLSGTFDVIILSDLINDVWDVQKIFENIYRICSNSTRLIINTYSRLWEIPLSLAKSMKLAKPELYQNWLTVEDTVNLLHLAGFEEIRHFSEILLPLPIPIAANFLNLFLVKLAPFKSLALTNFIVARSQREGEVTRDKPSVSVIIPARNEAGNIPAIFDRTPDMGSGTELVFIEGHSKDNTYEVIESNILNHPARNCKLLRQTGTGKGDAVRMGFTHARGDILIILDADLTVPPEDLPRFYDILSTGKAEFVNGVRLVYPMEKEAMRFFNLLGNKFFSMAFSWLLGQPIKDTLCGTKVLWKKDYDKITLNRAYFGDFDPFGDFDLLFGAAKLNLKIMDLPIRYRERTYGTTNIQRWKHGWLLLRMVLFAASRIKFV